MSRPENKMVMGFFAFDPKHHAAIASLVTPATPAHKLLDPFAGEGEVLETLSKAWGMTPYANELDKARAEACANRFGILRAVHGDAEHLRATQAAFAALWINPPYDHDAQGSTDTKRLEFKYLKQSWRWACDGALVFWVVYHHHLTDEAMAFFAKNASQVDVWGCAGKHLNKYDQIVVVATKGKHPDPDILLAEIKGKKAYPEALIPQDQPRYTLPQAPDKKQFMFCADAISTEHGEALVNAQGAWKNNAFQTLLHVPQVAKVIEPIVPPRPGHMALVLAAGLGNGAIIDTEAYGTVALRGKTTHMTQTLEPVMEADKHGNIITKTSTLLKPVTNITLMTQDGNVITLDRDEQLLPFIAQNSAQLTQYLQHRFKPAYQFDYAGQTWLNSVRLNGRHPLYTAQKHVIGAVLTGLKTRKGVLLAGQMGTGKTALGSCVTVAQLQTAKRGEVALIVAPPHLIDKWERELVSIAPNAFIAKVKRHEERSNST